MGKYLEYSNTENGCQCAGNQPAGIHLRGLPTLTAAVDRVAVDRVAPVDRVAEGEDQADLGNRNQNYKKINKSNQLTNRK